jgi:hypothetical protein
MPDRKVPLTVEQENEIAREKRLSEIRDRARVFREILGSPRGQLVLEALRKAFNYDSTAGIPPNRLDEGGRVDALQTWRKMGEYSVIRWIEIQLEWKESEHVNPSSGGT